MNKTILEETVKKLTQKPKGVLALDESIVTCHGRFEKLGVPQTPEKRWEYRNMLIPTEGLEEYISGVILVPETAAQKSSDGIPFPEILNNKGICVGITSNIGYGPFNDLGREQVTLGLDDLPERMKEFSKLGGNFSKWRELIKIGEGLPTEEFLKEDANRLASYVSICQSEDVVPFIEPEVMIDGDHNMEKCYEVTAHNLDIVFSILKEKGAYLPGIILKSSMVLPGKDNPNKAIPEKVAEMTVKCLREHVPSDIGGIVFLSGGQSDEEAALNLDAINKIPNLPWRATFSYGRAIQNGALMSWAKNPEDLKSAQNLLLEYAKRNSLASVGKYK